MRNVWVCDVPSLQVLSLWQTLFQRNPSTRAAAPAFRCRRACSWWTVASSGLRQEVQSSIGLMPRRKTNQTRPRSHLTSKCTGVLFGWATTASRRRHGWFHSTNSFKFVWVLSAGQQEMWRHDCFDARNIGVRFDGRTSSTHLGFRLCRWSSLEIIQGDLGRVRVHRISIRGAFLRSSFSRRTCNECSEAPRK